MHLWRTHCVFNQRLPALLKRLFAMRRGEVGGNEAQRQVYQRVAQFVLARDAKDSVDLLNAVSLRKRSANSAFKKKATISCNGQAREVTGEEVFAEAVALASKGVFAYDKDDMRAGLPDSLFQPLTRDAVACMRSHEELVATWKKEYREWRDRKSEWEAEPEHALYLNLRPKFEEGEAARGGRFRKRAERDHAYLDWLEANPQLAAWRRKAPPAVVPIDEAGKRRIARAKAWKQASVRAEEFWKRNPELHALHKIHVQYLREFVRPRRTRRNKRREGFKQRPTFTMPDPVRHPRWCLFNAPQTSPQGYRLLRLPQSRRTVGSVELRLLTGPSDGAGFPDAWVNVRFKADPRLAQLRPVKVPRTVTRGKNKGAKVEADGFRYYDDQLLIERDAQVSGVKLLFRDIRMAPFADKPIEDRLLSATPYLVFAVEIKDEARTERAKAIRFDETSELTKSGKKRKTLPAGLVSVAVDLDTRGVGFLTRAVIGVPEIQQTHHGVRLLQSRYVAVGQVEARASGEAEWSPGPDLAHIARHKREIRRLRQLRGKPVKGERSHVRLQAHIDRMGEDRFKKAARKIVNEALRGSNPAAGDPYTRADVLLYESLETLLPDAERERGINRALLRWNRAKLIEHLKRMCDDAGIRHFPVSPFGTSQVCSKCGALGRRYSLARENGRAVIRFGWVERLFACPNPECPGRRPDRPDRPFTCNSDHNASVNLHRVFALGDQAVAAFRALAPRDSPARTLAVKRVEDTLRPQLMRVHKLADAGVDSPF